MKRFEVLNDRVLLEVSGKDNFSFLQGIITNDIELVKKTNLIYSLILTPQGKFLYEIFIFYVDKKLYIDCFREKVDEIIAYLNKFKLKSDVHIKKDQNLDIIAIDETDKSNLKNLSKNIYFFHDPRLDLIGFRGIVASKDVEKISAELKMENFYYHRLASYAIPIGQSDMMEGRSFPLDYGIDILNGISFTKGCFVGQELTARMKHQQMVKRIICKVISEYDLDDLKRGEPILYGEKEIGVFLSGRAKFGSCLIKIEEYNNIKNKENSISLNNHQVSLEVPHWLKTSKVT